MQWACASGGYDSGDASRRTGRPSRAGAEALDGRETRAAAAARKIEGSVPTRQRAILPVWSLEVNRGPASCVSQTGGGGMSRRLWWTVAALTAACKAVPCTAGTVPLPRRDDSISLGSWDSGREGGAGKRRRERARLAAARETARGGEGAGGTQGVSGRAGRESEREDKKKGRCVGGSKTGSKQRDEEREDGARLEETRLGARQPARDLAPPQSPPTARRARP